MEYKPYGYVYKTTNLINGKIYIGQHKSDIFEPDKYIGSGKRLQEAIKKYGRENFKCELLDWAMSKLELDADEMNYIYIYRFLKPQAEMYNISSGGPGETHRYYTEEEKKNIKRGSTKGRIIIHKKDSEKRILESQLEQYIADGWERGRSDRVKRNLSRPHPEHIPWNKGLTKETNEKLMQNSENRKLYYSDPNHHGVQYNKPRTQEEKEKIRQGMTGKKNGIGNRSHSGQICINKDHINKWIKEKDLQQYLDCGLVRGHYKSKPKIGTIIKCIQTGKAYPSLQKASLDTGISVYYISKSISTGEKCGDLQFEKLTSAKELE